MGALVIRKGSGVYHSMITMASGTGRTLLVSQSLICGFGVI